MMMPPYYVSLLSVLHGTVKGGLDRLNLIHPARCNDLVPEAGLEPALPCGKGILRKEKKGRQIEVFLICCPFSFRALRAATEFSER